MSYFIIVQKNKYAPCETMSCSENVTHIDDGPATKMFIVISQRHHVWILADFGVSTANNLSWQAYSEQIKRVYIIKFSIYTRKIAVFHFFLTVTDGCQTSD